MLVMYAFGIPTAFGDFYVQTGFTQFANIHFIVSVAVSGSLSPWMYINLRRIYDEPMKVPIETLSSLQIASAFSPQEVSYDYDSCSRILLSRKY